MNYYLIILWSAFLVLITYLKHKYSYWSKRGVKQLYTNPIWGNLFKINTMHHSHLLQEIYDKFKGTALMAGTYFYITPIAVILDLDLVKRVLIKDFSNFVERFDEQNPKDIIAKHLFLARGDLWRSLRIKMTPTFTSGKMKLMFPTMVRVAEDLANLLERELLKSPSQVLEMHDINARFTTDVIGSCVFGIKCNSLEDPKAEFRNMGRRIFGRKHFSIKYELFGAFYDLLIELKNKKDENGKSLLSLDLVAAQLFVFFAAGFETSSSNMSYGLYEMAKNPHKQEKVRKEILETLEKHNNELTYEAMMEMSYLDQVITETLRLYPALAFLQRICMEDYKVPDSDIVLEKGTWVYIPAKAIHHDPKIYENPEEFQPERFHPSEVQNRHPQAFLGFGDGPRNCIGLRFGRMQVRIGLISLLSKFRFSVSEKTPDKLEISNHSFVMIPDKGVWLKVERL